jgi:hypothetical protein
MRAGRSPSQGPPLSATLQHSAVQCQHSMHYHSQPAGYWKGSPPVAGPAPSHAGLLVRCRAEPTTTMKALIHEGICPAQCSGIKYYIST